MQINIKYDGNEMDIAKFIIFHFSYFFVSISVSINGMKIFPLTGISISISISVNHTEEKFDNTHESRPRRPAVSDSDHL